MNLSTGGFDTHSDHDRQQSNALGSMLYGVDRLMDRIDMLGLRDRVVVVIGSDFGRTPFYNTNNGKDHWSLTSAMMMGAGIMGNRVVGGTDDHFGPRGLDLSALTPSDGSMVRLNPKQIHLALRRLAHVDATPVSQQFPIAAESIPLFG